MKEKLTQLWERCDTKLLADIFETYMKNLSIKKYDGRKKDNTNTYDIDGDSTIWARVQCYYYTDSTEYQKENLLLVLRKEAGDYFLIQRKNKRAFEIDYGGLKCYNEELLNEILNEHKILFDNLFEELNIV